MPNHATHHVKHHKKVKIKHHKFYNSKIIKTIERQKILDALLVLKNKVPARELYRFIVDGEKHLRENGWVSYEARENGSLKSALNGFALALSNLENPTLTIELIKELHKAITSNVSGIDTTPGMFRTQGASISNIGRDSSEQGLAEIYELTDSKNSKTSYILLENASIVPSMHEEPGAKLIPNNYLRKAQYGKSMNRYATPYFAPYPSDYNYTTFFIKRLQILIDTYLKDIKAATDSDRKIKVIVTFIRKCDLLHPFADANTRTFAIALLNRLLMQNGFLPALQNNPNSFELLSTSELVIYVKESINNTQALVNGKKDLFNFNSDMIPDTNQKLYPDMVSNFTKTIENEVKRLIILVTPGANPNSLFHKPSNSKVPDEKSNFLMDIGRKLLDTYLSFRG
jgi:hypothetical protein